MIKEYGKIFLIVGLVLFLIISMAFQISFINTSFQGLNIFFILILYLVLTKNNSMALIFAWLGGLLTSGSYFSKIGVNSLILLILTAALIILYKTLFFNIKTESVLFIGIAGVILYNFLSWLLLDSENIGFYFFNFGILTELIVTTLFLMAILKIRIQNA